MTTEAKAKRRQKKLKQPLNLFANGTVDTKVVGIGFAEYDVGGAMVVILIFHPGDGEPISVNLPEQSDLLEEGEFFIKDWSDKEHIVKKLVEHGLVTILDKPRIPSGHVMVAAAKINEDALTDFTAEEAERYHA